MIYEFEWINTVKTEENRRHKFALDMFIRSKVIIQTIGYHGFFFYIDDGHKVAGTARYI